MSVSGHYLRDRNQKRGEIEIELGKENPYIEASIGNSRIDILMKSHRDLQGEIISFNEIISNPLRLS